MIKLWLSLFAAWAAAAPETATLTYVTGSVRVADQAAKASQTLHAGDTVQTGPDAAAIVTLPDRSQVKLKASTSLLIRRLSDPVDLKLQSGGVFAKVEKQKGPGRFLLRTHAAVMGVRGTQFFTSFGRESRKGADVWMCVNEGSVEVQGLTEGAAPVLVQPGEGVFVSPGEGVTPPKPYAWTKRLNWNMSPEAGDVADRSRIDYKDLIKQDYD